MWPSTHIRIAYRGSMHIREMRILSKKQKESWRRNICNDESCDIWWYIRFRLSAPHSYTFIQFEAILFIIFSTTARLLIYLEIQTVARCMDTINSHNSNLNFNISLPRRFIAFIHTSKQAESHCMTSFLSFPPCQHLTGWGEQAGTRRKAHRMSLFSFLPFSAAVYCHCCWMNETKQM